MRHFATAAFWFQYRQLPAAVRALADKNFASLVRDEHHASLRFSRVAGPFWSARVGLCITGRWPGSERRASCGSGSGITPSMTRFYAHRPNSRRLSGR